MDAGTKGKKLESSQVWLWGWRVLLLLLLIAGGLFLRRPLLLENRAGLLTPVFAAFVCFLAIPWLRDDILGGRHWVLTLVLVPIMLALSSRTFQEWHSPGDVAAIPGWVDGLLLAGCYVVVARGFFFLVQHGAKTVENRLRQPALVEPAEKGPLSFWMPFAATLLTLTAFWLYVFYPSGTSPDVEYQLRMIQGGVRLNDIHTPAHTILLALLQSIGPGNAVFVAVQILLVSFLSGLFGRYLARSKGVPVQWMVLLNIVFALGTYAFVYMYPWKDTPYMFCVGIIVYYCMRMLDEDFSPGMGGGVALGLSLAFAYLFRYNGIILAVVCGIVFIIWAIRKKLMRFLCALLLAIVVAVAGINVYAYRVMDMERWENGFSLQVFASGIAAVVAEGGEITDEELYQVDDLMGLEWVYSHYAPWSTRDMFWTLYEYDEEGFFDDESHAVYNNHMVVKLGGHAVEVVSLYLRLLPRNLGIMAADVVYNTWIIWGLTDFFCHAFLAILFVLAMLACWTRKTLRKRWVVFLPVLCNTLSILISTITNEERYLLPTYTLFVPLLLYVLATADKGTGAGGEAGMKMQDALRRPAENHSEG